MSACKGHVKHTPQSPIKSTFPHMASTQAAYLRFSVGSSAFTKSHPNDGPVSSFKHGLIRLKVKWWKEEVANDNSWWKPDLCGYSSYHQKLEQSSIPPPPSAFPNRTWRCLVALVRRQCFCRLIIISIILSGSSKMAFCSSTHAGDLSVPFITGEATGKLGQCTVTNTLEMPTAQQP